MDVVWFVKHSLQQYLRSTAARRDIFTVDASVFPGKCMLCPDGSANTDSTSDYRANCLEYSKYQVYSTGRLLVFSGSRMRWGCNAPIPYKVFWAWRHIRLGQLMGVVWILVPSYKF